MSAKKSPEKSAATFGALNAAFPHMLPHRSSVDDYEAEVPTAPNPENRRQSAAMPHARPDESAIFARRSARALYVPSPLPMCELKKAMARADDEVTHDDSSPPPSHEDAPPSSAPTRLHREPSPFELAKTSLAHTLESAQARRLSSHVDADEEKANLGWRYAVPPLPALEEFAPIVGGFSGPPGALPVPGLPFAATTAVPTPSAKRSGMRTAATIGISLFVAAVAIVLARGDLAPQDARHAAAAVERAATHVLGNVKRP